MKRILVISCEAWRMDTNAGNVLANIFDGMKAEFEFAQIYVSSQMPENEICRRYFQFSERDLLLSFVGKVDFGKELTQRDLYEGHNIKDFTNSGSFYSFRQRFPGIIYPIRNLLWRLSKWKSERLRAFILDFNPDIIFAPIYYDPFMARIAEYASDLCNKKLVSYTGDDHLTFKQYSLSPLYWINRAITRRTIISLSKRYALLYTMTKEQKEEYEKILKIPIKIFTKGGDFSSRPLEKQIHDPIKIVYGGGLIFRRYTTLSKVRRIISNINKKHGKRYELYIYTQTPITPKFRRLLHDGENSYLMGKVGQDELRSAYASADIALHVESFELAARLDTRMSFSTKIIDLFQTNCCLLAICWKKSSPYIYLEKEDAAICVGDVNGLYAVLEKIIDSPQIISEYAQKGWFCGERNHQIEKVTEGLKKDFYSVINKSDLVK